MAPGTNLAYVLFLYPLELRRVLKYFFKYCTKKTDNQKNMQQRPKMITVWTLKGSKENVCQFLIHSNDNELLLQKSTNITDIMLSEKSQYSRIDTKRFHLNKIQEQAN